MSASTSRWPSCPTRQIVPLALPSEELGYGGIYVSDHVFNPRSRESRYTYSKREDGHPGWEDETAWPDPMCVISALASLTENSSSRPASTSPRCATS